VAKTDVIISTAGPFQLYGTPVVDACVRLKTDYCDITGESPWIREIIDKYHSTAVENKVWIVPSTGFDSIPSDLGTYIAVEYIREKYHVGCRKVQYFLTDISGGVSGGTLASVLNIMEMEKSKLKAMGNPYYLNPADCIGNDKPDKFTVAYNNQLKSWTGPNMMAGINTRIVRRSWSFLRETYGSNFSYEEAITGSFIYCSIVGLGLLIFVLLALFAPTRNIVKKVVTQPGSGPSRKAIDNGHFTVEILAQTDEAEPHYVKAVVKGVKDPGYGETSKMIAETAITLALHRSELRSKFSGGILTTACIGSPLVERLRSAGMTFSVSDF